MVLLLLLEQGQPVDQLDLLLLVERLQAGQLAGRQMVLVRRRERLAGQLFGKQKLLLLLLVLLLVTQPGQHERLELGLGWLLLPGTQVCGVRPCRELAIAMVLLTVHQLERPVEGPQLVRRPVAQLGRGQLPLGSALVGVLILVVVVVVDCSSSLLAGSQLLRVDQLAQGEPLLVSLEGGQPLLVQLLVLDELLTKVCQFVALGRDGPRVVRVRACVCVCEARRCGLARAAARRA